MNDIIPQPQANRHGSKCPGWCRIDHAHVNMHTGQPIDPHISAAVGDDLGDVRVTLMKDADGGRKTQVHISALEGFAFVSPGMADDLAGLIESLADCTPARLRGLADEIRQAVLIARDTDGGAR